MSTTWRRVVVTVAAVLAAGAVSVALVRHLARGREAAPAGGPSSGGRQARPLTGSADGWPASASSAATAGDDAWRMAGRDPGRTRASAVRVAPPLRERWRVAVPDGEQVAVRLATHKRLYCLRVGGTDGVTVMALEAATGDIVWSCPLPGHHPALPYPVLEGNRLWILDDAGGRGDPDSPRHDQLLWVDADSGVVHPCVMPRRGGRPAGGAVERAEELGDGVLGDSAICPLSAGGLLISVRVRQAYSLDDGSHRPRPVRNTFPSLGTTDEVVGVGDSLMTVGLDQAGLLLLAAFTDPRTAQLVGEVAWSQQEWHTERWLEGLCAAPDGSCAFLTDSQRFQHGPTVTVGLEPTGRVRWRSEGYVSLGIVGAGRLFCRGTRRNSDGEVTTVAGLSLTSGDVLWERSVPGVPVTTGVLTGDVLWLGRMAVARPASETRATAYSAELAAYSAATGEELGQMTMDSYVGQLLACGGALYARCVEGNVGERRSSIVALEHDEQAGER